MGEGGRRREKEGEGGRRREKEGEEGRRREKNGRRRRREEGQCTSPIKILSIWSNESPKAKNFSDFSTDAKETIFPSSSFTGSVS